MEAGEIDVYKRQVRDYIDIIEIGTPFVIEYGICLLYTSIGQHHFHMIPKGLPGEGNLMVFDNGGWGGYGVPNPGSRNGSKNALRDYSRVLEFNPITLEVVWKLTPKELAHAIPTRCV